MVTRPVTAPFSAEHAELRKHLGHIQKMIGDLAAAAPPARRRTMETVVAFLNEHIRPHAEWEERVLYPLVDRHAGSGREPFTATMRHEHRIVGRWIEELAREAARSQPDVWAFSRRSDNLLGLLAAHFEDEEEVLLPILERVMTREEFQREVMDRAEHH